MPAITVLVVEDDPAIGRGIVDALKVSGYNPTQACNGTEAIDAVTAGGVDLVLLDVMMPSPDGFEVLTTLRRTHPTLPVIMVTARGAEQDRVRGLTSGADDYLVKPFGIRELLARVEAVLRRSSGATACTTSLTCGKVTVDLGRRTVVGGGEDVELTDREAAILQYLYSHQDRAIDRDDLLRHIWGSAPEGIETRTVDIHVSRLRSKIGDGFIETVRGCGYRLGATVGEASP